MKSQPSESLQGTCARKFLSHLCTELQVCFLVMVSVFSAPPRLMYLLIIKHILLFLPLCLSLLISQALSLPLGTSAPALCGGPGHEHMHRHKHTRVCTHTHTHIKTCAYKHRSIPAHLSLAGPALLKQISSSSVIPSALFLPPSFPTLFIHESQTRKGETLSLECTINKYLISGLTLTYF